MEWEECLSPRREKALAVFSLREQVFLMEQVLPLPKASRASFPALHPENLVGFLRRKHMKVCRLF